MTTAISGVGNIASSLARHLVGDDEPVGYYVGRVERNLSIRSAAKPIQPKGDPP